MPDGNYKINNFNAPRIIELIKYELHSSRYSDPSTFTEKVATEVDTFLQLMSTDGLKLRSISTDSRRVDVILESNIHVRHNYNGTNTISHNQTVVDGLEAIRRGVLLIATVKDNYQYLSDNSVRKWLKGEVKIPEEDWLNHALSQSMENRLRKMKRPQ